MVVELTSFFRGASHEFEVELGGDCVVVVYVPLATLCGGCPFLVEPQAGSWVHVVILH